MSRVAFYSFQSKLDLLQKRKQVTEKYILISIYRKREEKGIKGRIQKEAGKLQPIKVSISETIGG